MVTGNGLALAVSTRTVRRFLSGATGEPEPEQDRPALDLIRVPPAGFEPAISALKGLRPRPLDDEGVFRSRSTSTVPQQRRDDRVGV